MTGLQRQARRGKTVSSGLARSTTNIYNVCETWRAVYGRLPSAAYFFAMLFNSLTFVVFYVIVTTLYWSIGRWNARKNLLVVASYIFYGAWNPPFAALLFSTTAMDFWLGRQIAKATDHKKRWLVASVCMNLSMLGFFKYGNFLLQNF